MSKRRREKHDINLTRPDPGSAKKMKISSRLRRRKAEPQTDSNIISTAYVSPDCRSKIYSGRRMLNNSHSESDTEIIWDGNSPTAHLQRRIGRHGRNKAGDISEMVQCVNSPTGNTDNDPADMPLLGLWMSRSPSHPAVDLSVVRKTLGPTDQESSKPKITRRKTSGRVSLLQAELEKIANAINNSVSKDAMGGHMEENSTIPEGHQEPLCTKQLQQKEPVHTGQQLSQKQLVTENVSRDKPAPNDAQHVSHHQANTRQFITDQSDTGTLSISQFNSGHLVCDQSNSGRPDVSKSKVTQSASSQSDGSSLMTVQSSACRVPTSQSKVGQSVNGQTNANSLVTGQSNTHRMPIAQSKVVQSLSGQPLVQCSVSQPIASKLNSGSLLADKSGTSQSSTSVFNSGQSVTGKTNVGCLVTGQSSTGQASLSKADNGQLVIGKSNTHRFAAGQSSTCQRSTSQSLSGQSFSGKSNTGYLVTGLSIGHKSSTNTGQSVIVGKSHAGHVLRGLSSTGQICTSVATIGQSVTVTSNAGTVITSQSIAHLSSISHFNTDQLVNVGKSNTSCLVTGQCRSGQTSTFQSITSQAAPGHSNASHLVTNHLRSGQTSIPQVTTGQALTVKANSGCSITCQSSTHQPSTSQLKPGHLTSDQLNAGHMVTGQYKTPQLSLSHSSTGFQIYSGHLMTGQSSKGQSSTTRSTVCKAVTVKSNSGHSTAGRANIGRSFVFKSKTSQSPPEQSINVSHPSSTSQASTGHSNLGQVSFGQSSSSTSSSNRLTRSQSVMGPASADYDDSVWSGCLDDETLLEQLSQAEALEKTNTTGQQSSTGSFKPNPPACNSNQASKFNPQTGSTNQPKLVTGLTRSVVGTISASTNGTLKKTNTEPLINQESAADPFDGSLTDDMLISLCTGMDSPQRQPSSTADTKSVTATRTISASVKVAPKDHKWQQSTSGLTHLLSHDPPVSSRSHLKPIVPPAQTGNCQKVCSQTEIEKKRQQAMARRKKHGKSSGRMETFKGAGVHGCMPPSR
ncbi:probable serine/threonine-protein kinase dyrk2 isoform X2 [Acanthaster planci]|uniref:Probable serine/threonine-protein kinase dyrk2 isoform X2 n=1 Tax=Acanthaster planci TaxID=133434 RepID=A0A8B7ZDS7_ACAPL|nr:probable serine/threonine-protein kinase dyrk2 isoform X2 [Acanthaster planci]